jgi:hypothetical protein
VGKSNNLSAEKEKTIETLLTFMELGEPDKRTKKYPNHCLNIRNFKNARIFDDSFMAEDAWWFRDVKPTDVNNFFDQTTVSTFSERRDPGQLCSVLRVKTINMREARNKVSKFYPLMVEFTGAAIMKSGEYASVKHFYSYVGSQWQRITLGYEREIEQDKDIVEILKLAPSFQFSARYEWSASLSYSGGPSVMFPTNPSGVKELFRLRDIPPGKTRRQAIKHWVTEHTRRINQPEKEIEVQVRKHLRGQTKFNWNGLLVSVHPSDADLDENDNLKLLKRTNN